MPTTFGEFLDEYERDFVLAPETLSASTQKKYLSHLKNHIRPAFGSLPMVEITTKRIDLWLAEKTAKGLAWSTRCDLRNLMSGIFSQAERWDRWEGKNPARHARVGRKKMARERRKLTVEETRHLLDVLPSDVRLIVMVALFCTLRISEVMGLCWKHVDLDRGVLMVRQRYYRGDLDETKSEHSCRDLPLGHLVGLLRDVYPGPQASEEFVFGVRTRRGQTRQDRSINRYFLRKAAKQLGIYWKGFGFHVFRREAITAIASQADPLQAMRAAGHTHMDVTLLYTLNDFARQEAAVRTFQEQLGLKKAG
ncbi:MAG: tyrosine-type recombinase/integrase [Bryobacterales bacterium]|nr:tyrosine-type recombinase/integrase [Bryobacterales bacterium]